MKLNNLLPWHRENWALFCRYIKQNRIPQALLISGPKGLGKYDLTKHFAYSLLCNNRREDACYCKECRSCRLIESNTHPDLNEIKPEEGKSTISVDQIRRIVADTTLKPQFEGYRAVIINPADAMTLSAANAFLKCLEEPAERTVFILITTNPIKLPATIISRCQMLDITFPDNSALLDWLNSKGINQNQETLINLLKVSALKIEQLSDKTTLKRRADCFEDWLGVASGSSYPAMVAEKWQQIPETELLNWLISWVSDLIKCTNRIDAKWLCNRDFTKSFQSLSEKSDIKDLYSHYSHLLKTQQQIGTSINFQIMTEEFLVQWSRLNGRY
jgi:DNA polymerase III subunit delta'